MWVCTCVCVWVGGCALVRGCVDVGVSVVLVCLCGEERAMMYVGLLICADVGVV